MMRDGKRIVIKTPFLRDLRRNLRSLIISAVHSEVKMLDQFLKMYENKSYSQLTQDEREDREKFYEMKWSLIDSLCSSICECNTCTRSDRDMVYVEDVKGWCCTECYDNDKYFTPSKLYTSPKYNYVAWYNQKKEEFNRLYKKDREEPLE